uniref:Glycosyltransferase family 92 protein n=1 Tax=Oryzias latipes TaxID=8090 RepID=A0A3P9LS60_ORYLA
MDHLSPTLFASLKENNKSFLPATWAEQNSHICNFSQSITPLKHTKHLLVSAYMDQRSGGFDLRIIGIFKRDSVDALYCSFCCAGLVSETTPSIILPHSDHFGFPYGTMDVLCQIPDNCDATHVTFLTAPSTATRSEQLWMPIRNKKTSNKEENKLDFTVCISTLFGNYNNVLQFAQTLEMYRLLGVNRVVIYNTSCGPELNRLPKSYSQEGFVEMVPWPIDRSMERSRYIIMPYQHDNLNSMMDMLQSQHPNVKFLIENHIFPKKYFEPSRKFHLHRWSNVPGINILEHIYREDPNSTYHPYKMIVQPRLVEQTSVHQLLRNLGEQFYSLQWEELNEDKRLWDFQEKVIPNVDQVLRRAGLLTED